MLFIIGSPFTCFIVNILKSLSKPWLGGIGHAFFSWLFLLSLVDHEHWQPLILPHVLSLVFGKLISLINLKDSAIGHFICQVLVSIEKKKLLQAQCFQLHVRLLIKTKYCMWPKIPNICLYCYVFWDMMHKT